MKKNAVVVLTLSGILIIAIVVILLSNRVDKKPDPQNIVDLNDTAEQGNEPQDQSGLSQDNTSGERLVGEDEPLYMDGNADGTVPGQTGDVAGTAQGQTGGNTDGTASGQTGDVAGAEQGQTGGNIDGIALGQTGGDAAGATQGQTDGNVTETAQGQTGGGTDETTQGQVDGSVTGTTQGQTGGNTTETAQGQMGGSTDGTAQGQADGTGRTDTAPEIAEGNGTGLPGQEAVETSGGSTIADETEDGLSQEVMLAIAALQYDESKGLPWPIHGEVVLNYSDDHLIYHKTLDQFRTHPAVAIGASIGSLVTAAADGIVTAIEESAMTGMTVTTAIGNDYSLIYGQLADCTLQVGDRVAQGEVIGTVGQVSRFYHLEGDNLYFEVRNGEETVNPMSLFLDSMDDMDITSTETIESMETPEDEKVVDTVVEENGTE